jgi:SAM-dependent methyltransferase
VEDAREHRFYRDLAPWWELISPVEGYAEEGAYVTGLLAAHRPRVTGVLELGSGGGHLASFLTPAFDLTLADLSPAMLARSERLNPTSVHVAGDMRTLRLGRTFDAVVLHDAVAYMLDADDLRAALTTAYVHLRPGGLAVVLPDETAETFAPREDVGGSDGDDRAVRFLEWSTGPDADGQVRTEYVFALRRGEDVEVVHETHRTGLFSRARWLDLFAEVGFEARRIVEETTEDRHPRDVFLAVRAAP